MSIERAKCTNCGGNLQVDSEKKTAICPFCRAEYIVQDAINNYRIVNEYKIQHVDTVIQQDERSSTVQLQQMDSCIVQLRDYKKAEEIAQAILKTTPNVYQAWWGLIRIRTEDLTTCDTRSSVWKELDGYAEKVLRLAPASERPFYEQKWAAFLQLRQNVRTQRQQAILARQAEIKGEMQRLQTSIAPTEGRIKQIQDQARGRAVSSTHIRTAICFVVAVALAEWLINVIKPLKDLLMYFLNSIVGHSAAPVVLIIIGLLAGVFLGFFLMGMFVEFVDESSVYKRKLAPHQPEIAALKQSISAEKDRILELEKESMLLEEQYPIACGEELIDVVLTDVPSSWTAMLRTLSSITGVGEAEVRKLISKRPCVIKAGTTREKAESIKTALERTGAKVTLK